jgi:hypothetical protein
VAGRGSLVAALLATLAHPRWWVLALAGFLLRGGVVFLLMPITVPPTVAGIAAILSPTLVVLAAGGGLPIGPLILIATAIFAWLVVAGWLGAWFDATLAGEAAADEDLGPAGRSQESDGGSGPLPPGLGTVRFAPHVATAVVFVVAAIRVVQVAYVEATSPGAPTMPFAIRVLGETLGPVVALVAIWLLAEAAGGLSLRALLAAPPGAGPPNVTAAIGLGIRSAFRWRSLVTLATTTLVTLVVGLVGGLAAGRAWSQLRLLAIDGADAGGLAIGLFLFIAVVFGWLALLSLALAWRSTVWTTRATVTPPYHGASEASR